MFNILNELSFKDKVDYILFFSIPLISLFMIEFSARLSLQSTFYWPVADPLQFLGSLLLFYVVYVFLWSLIRHRACAALLYSLLWMAVSCISGSKTEVLGLPFMPWDIKSGSNVAGLLDSFNILQFNFLTNWIFLLTVAVNITVIILIFARQGSMYIKRPACYIVSVVCIFAAIAILITLPKVDLADSASVYQKDGYVRGFIISAQLWAKTNDTDASGPSCDDQYKFTDKKATTAVKPNVIFIMSEAFWDVTKLPDLTFSEDPIPNLRDLSKEGLSGEMVSNTYGGSTDNVEFEIMTGFSLKYLPFGTNPYMTCITRPIPALPSYFKSIGYQTIAVHPNINNFFNRNVVYPLLGIDRFVTSENMPDAALKGTYISDDTFADYIISEYKQAQKPVFMYNISMQNHWPYIAKNYYKKYDITVKCSDKLDSDSMTAMQNYTQGVHDADASLKKITDYFRTVKEPTVIVFLGDHLPALTDGLGVYKKLGYVDEALIDPRNTKVDKTTEELLIQNEKILETPYLIWSNYNTVKGKGETLSSNYLGIYALSETGLEL